MSAYIRAAIVISDPVSVPAPQVLELPAANAP